MAQESLNAILMKIQCSEAAHKTPELKELQNLITPDYAYCWREIGIGLNLPYSTLQIIEANNPKVEQRCTDILAKWLQTDVNATWQKLLQVINSPAIAKMLPQTSESDPNESKCLQVAAEHLCKSYVESRHSFSPSEWPPYQPKHYTTLALIHVEKHTSTEVISVTRELASKGKIENKSENILKYHDDNITYQSKSISEIFSNNLLIGHSLILIEGAPGIGKTVMSKEIAFQWANNILLNHKKLVFLIFLQDPNLANVKSLEDLMAYVFKTKVFNSLTEYLIETKGKDITIILDGYDEMPEEHRQNSLIADIINFAVLSDCSLVITSRPTASVHLHTMAHCRVEILGFAEKDRLDYITHALQGDDFKVEKVKSYLQSHSTINALCYIPLNMTILLSLFEETPFQTNVPHTQTEMYEKFIKVTIIRFLKKISNIEFSSVAEFSDLPKPHSIVFCELSKLAYNALVKDQIVFTIDEISKACPHLTMKSNNWNGLGLIKAAHYGSGSVLFHFLHFSVQEYMAAYYIAYLLPNNQEQLKLLKNTFWNVHYFNTWIMYVGITHGESFAWRHFLSGNWLQLSTHLSKSSSIHVSKKLLHNKVKCLHLFQCFIEGSSKSIEQLAQSFFQDRVIDLSNQPLKPQDVNILGFFLLRSINKQWKKINLSRCNLRDVGCIALCKMFMHKRSRGMLKVDVVDFSYNHLQLHTICTLLDVFKSWSTTDAVVCDNNHDSFTTSEELNYFEEIINLDPTKVYFQSVSIMQSLFANKATQNSISNHLSNSVQFTGLYLNECNWDNISLSQNRVFVDLIKKQKLSKVHIIGKTNIVCIKGIAEVIKEVKSIYIYDNTLIDSEVNKIGNILLYKGSVSEVIIVIGQKQIIGKLHTIALNTKLTSSEIYHLFTNIKNLCYNSSQSLVNYFELKNYNSSFGNEDFYDLFILLQNNPMQCQVSICVIKDNVLLAHKCKCEDIIEKLYNCPGLNSLYISYCDLYKTVDFIDAFRGQSLLVNCYILNSNLENKLIESIYSNSINKVWKRNTLNIMIHTVHPSCKIAPNIFNYDYLAKDSVMLVTEDAIVGYNVTYELFSLSLQLQSQVTAWKFSHSKFDFKMLDLMNNVQPFKTNYLIGMEFLCCSIGDRELQFLKNTQCFSCLTKFSVSGFKELHKIIEDIAIFILHNPQLKELDISNLYLDYKSFDILAQPLKRLSMLTKLNISNIGDVLDKDIALVLSNNVKMEELDLSSLTVPDFFNIASSMKNFWHLKQLNISNNNVAVDIIRDIVSHNTKLEHLDLSSLSLCLVDFLSIAESMKCTPNLKSLNISKNDGHNRYISKKPVSETTSSESDSIVSVFLNHVKLEDLNLNSLSLTSEDLITITTAMSNTSNLRKLDITDNVIDGKAIDAIITLLYHNINLEIFNISDVSLNKEDVIKVAKIMQERTKLTKISICCDEITGDAADAIAAILSYNSRLKEIKIKVQSIGYTIEISENLTKFVLDHKHINKQAAYTITALLSNNTTLENFSLCNCVIQVADAIRIFKGMKNISTLRTFENNLSKYVDQAANAIAEVLANNKELKVINLFFTDLRPISAIKIFNGMKNLTNLIKLNVSRNDITDKEAYEVTDTLAPLLSQISHLTTKPVTHTAVQCLASVLESNPKLQVLNIGFLHLNSKETIVLFRGMSNLTNLIELNIINSTITTDAAKILASILLSNISLRRLYLSSCSLQTGSAIDVFNALKNCSHLMLLDIRGNDNISDEAENVLKAILSCNSKLKCLKSINN